MNYSTEFVASLIEKANKVKGTAGQTIPFHAPEVAPKLACELLDIRFEAMRNCIISKELNSAVDDAKKAIEDLVGYYQNYFTRIPLK